MLRPTSKPLPLSHLSLTEVLEMGGQVRDPRKLTGHSHFTLHGDAEMYYRLMFRRTPKSDWKRLSYYIALAGGVRGSDVTDLKPSEASAVESLSILTTIFPATISSTGPARR